MSGGRVLLKLGTRIRSRGDLDIEGTIVGYIVTEKNIIEGEEEKIVGYRIRGDSVKGDDPHFMYVSREDAFELLDI